MTKTEPCFTLPGNIKQKPQPASNTTFRLWPHSLIIHPGHLGSRRNMGIFFTSLMFLRPIIYYVCIFLHLLLMLPWLSYICLSLLVKCICFVFLSLKLLCLADAWVAIKISLLLMCVLRFRVSFVYHVAPPHFILEIHFKVPAPSYDSNIRMLTP